MLSTMMLESQDLRMRFYTALEVFKTLVMSLRREPSTKPHPGVKELNAAICLLQEAVSCTLKPELYPELAKIGNLLVNLGAFHLKQHWAHAQLMPHSECYLDQMTALAQVGTILWNDEMLQNRAVQEIISQVAKIDFLPCFQEQQEKLLEVVPQD